MLWTVALSVGAITLIYFALIKPFSYWSNKGVRQITYRESWKDYFRRYSLADTMQYFYEKCGKSRYLGIYQFYNPALLIKDPELIKQLAVKNSDHFTDHFVMIYDEDYEPLWSRTLLILRGQNWKQMRATISPAFTSSKIKSMYNLILNCAKQFSEHFENQDEDVIEVNLKDIFGRYANDVIANCAFGVECNSLKDEDNDFFLMGKETNVFSGFRRIVQLITLMAFPKLAKLLGFHLFSQKITNFFSNLVRDSVAVREENNIIRPDLIHLLMEARKGRLKFEENDKNQKETGFATVEESDVGRMNNFSREISLLDMTAHSFSFFFAGFESISTLISFMGYELGVNPDIQQRLYEEIVEASKQSDGSVSYEVLNRMKYLDMVVAETLRKWPTILALDRVCTKPYTIEPEKDSEVAVNLSKGDFLFIPVYGFHRDPELYPDPERFDPERFSDENKHNIKPYTYLPFGVGPRNCIGSRFALLEVKAIIYHVLLAFEIIVTDKTPIPLLLKKSSFVMAPDKDFMLGFKKRTKIVCDE